MLRVAYRSTANNPDLALVALADILATSDRNNRRDELTGALLVSRGRFFQVLEGAPVDVNRALDRIDLDPRHRDVKVVLSREVTSRLFRGWSMVAVRVTPDIEARVDQVIDDCEAHPTQAVDEIYRLVERQRSGG